MGGPQSRCGRLGEEKNLLPLPGFEPRTVQPAAWYYSGTPLTQKGSLFYFEVKKGGE
jgi:hypothetical protein